MSFQTIQIKHSQTASSVPTTLAFGELAVNVTDKKLWVGKSDNSVVEITTSGSSYTAGNGIAINGSNQISVVQGVAVAGSIPVSVNPTGLTVAYDTVTMTVNADTKLTPKPATAASGILPVDITAGLAIKYDPTFLFSNSSGQLSVLAINGGTF